MNPVWAVRWGKIKEHNGLNKYNKNKRSIRWE